MKPSWETEMAPSVADSGVVVSVRGSVVDIRFDQHLPPIYWVLRTGAERQIVIEVRARLHRERDAMQRADKNIDGLPEDLNGTFHHLRQSGIDEELFDVVAGFNAPAGP